MNAQEARKKAYSVNTDKAESQYAKIQEQIDKEVNKGKYQLFWYEFINHDVRNKLELEGFKVGSDQGKYNETCIKISW